MADPSDNIAALIASAMGKSRGDDAEGEDEEGSSEEEHIDENDTLEEGEAYLGFDLEPDEVKCADEDQHCRADTASALAGLIAGVVGEVSPPQPAEDVVVVELGTSKHRIGWSQNLEASAKIRGATNDLTSLLVNCEEELNFNFGSGDCPPIMLVVHPSIETSSLHNLLIHGLQNLECPRLCLKSSASMTLRALSRPTGLVVDLGATHSFIVPVYEGQVVYPGIRDFSRVSGNVLDDFMASLLITNERLGDTSDSTVLGRKIKEAFCQVSLSYDADLNAIQEGFMYFKEVLIPPPESRGGLGFANACESIEVDEERIICPEALFKPWLVPLLAKSEDHRGLPELVVEAVNECDPDVRKVMLENIVLAGSGAKFPGLGERLREEVSARVPKAFGVEVVRAAPKNDGDSSPWWGGALFSRQRAMFRRSAISNADFENDGPSLANHFFP